MNVIDVVKKAREKQTIVPAFNIPFLTMVEPITQAIKDKNSVGLIEVARVEWLNMSSESLEAVAKEYHKFKKTGYTFLHLDHIPVIDENGFNVDYMPFFERAVASGFESAMIDGSRLSLKDNISATYKVAEYLHKNGLACEAELGAVMGHESEPLDLSYDEIFERKIGFTKVEEAKQFAKESQCDWLSVAVGSIHGAVAASMRDQKKPAGKLDINYLLEINDACNIPLVLHGGSGISKKYIHEAMKSGIAKMNIGTEIRQQYETAIAEGKTLVQAQEVVYDTCCDILKNSLEIENNYDVLIAD